MRDRNIQGTIAFQHEPDGSTRLALMLAGQAVSRLWINPLMLAIGAARIRVDGIGGVSTDEDWRNHGFARRLMETGVERMLTGSGTRSGPAQLSLLWGIPNFYQRFGYTPVMPEVTLFLTELSKAVPMPDGWKARACEPRDVASIRALYDANTARAIGAAVRRPDERVWSKLVEAANDPARDECGVAEDPDGTVAAYAWRGRDFGLSTPTKKAQKGSRSGK